MKTEVTREMQVRALAIAFAHELKACLRVDLALVDVQNQSAPQGVCHSHDYLDANMVMARAFRVVVGRNPNVQSDEDCALWSKAWNVAKSEGFVKLSGSPSPIADADHTAVLVLWTGKSRRIKGGSRIAFGAREIGEAITANHGRRGWHFVQCYPVGKF